MKSSLLIALALFAGTACTNGVTGPWGTIGGKWRYHCAPAKVLGQYCEVQEECAPGSFCDTAKKACSKDFLALGAPCSPGVPACSAGLYCRNGVPVGHCYQATCANGACTAGAKIGTPCKENPDCGANAMCVFDDNTPAICAVRPKTGEKCDDILHSCEKGNVCPPNTMTCAPFTKAGGACTIKETCEPGMLCLDASKNFADWEHPGTCQPNPGVPVGGSCVGAVCVAGAHCDYSKNKCAKDYPIGAKCSQGNECGEAPGIPADCVQGKCVATTSAGASCYPGPETRCTGGLVCASEAP
jgi:hypothetical protein